MKITISNTAEILVSGIIEKELLALGIDWKCNYSNTENGYKVFELSNEHFEILCAHQNDPDKGMWQDGGWRSAVGSVLGTPTTEFIINGERITAWINEQRLEDMKQDYVDDGEEWTDEEYQTSYNSLLSYLCDEHGASTFKNVCALTTHLANSNDITMAELWQKYQADIEF